MPTNGSRYDTFIAGTFADNSHWAFGGIEKCLDFTYFVAGRTANGTDGRIKFDVVNSSITASLNGNASTATKLATARTISITGAVTGSGSFDGNGNLSISTSVNHSHSYLPLSGGTLSGHVVVSGAGEKYVEVVDTDTNNAMFLDSGESGNAGL